jgi:hypothetical protein
MAALESRLQPVCCQNGGLPTTSALDIPAGVKDDDEVELEFYSVVQERSANRNFCLEFSASPPRRTMLFQRGTRGVAIMGQFWPSFPRARLLLEKLS